MSLLSVINRGRAILVLAVVLATGAATAQSAVERFELLNSCLPMNLVVEGLDSDATAIGLTEGAARAAVESRLRSARLYDSETNTILYVNIAVLRQAFSISLRYYRPVRALESGLVGLGITWNTGGIGTHAGDPDYILSSLRRYMDRFLSDYLRVNEEAC